MPRLSLQCLEGVAGEGRKISLVDLELVVLGARAREHQLDSTVALFILDEAAGSRNRYGEPPQPLLLCLSRGLLFGRRPTKRTPLGSKLLRDGMEDILVLAPLRRLFGSRGRLAL